MENTKIESYFGRIYGISFIEKIKILIQRIFLSEFYLFLDISLELQ